MNESQQEVFSTTSQMFRVM